MLTVLRLLYTLILVEFLGPLVISLSRMLLTVGRFLIVSVLILVSFALGLTQLFAPYQTLMPCTDDVDEEESLCGQTEMFSRYGSGLSRYFFLSVLQRKYSCKGNLGFKTICNSFFSSSLMVVLTAFMTRYYTKT